MTDNLENVSELFLSKLKSAPNSGVVLAQFYASITGGTIGRPEIIKLNHLIKLFGRMSVFFSILEIGRKPDFTEFPYGLLYKICKDKLELTSHADMTIAAMKSLDRQINDAIKSIDKVRQIDPNRYFKEEGT
jgi:hypothetical protein